MATKPPEQKPPEQSQQVVRPQSPVMALDKFLTARQKRLAEWAAGRLDPAALIRFALMDYARDARLRLCTPESIYLALIACAQTGLEPGALRQHAFIIAYKDIATFMIGWRGFVHLARRSKVQLTSELVYHADVFKPIKGTDRRLIHEPSLDESPLRGAYALALSLDHEEPPLWDYMSLKELQKVRDFAVRMRGGKLGAYETWDDQMLRKAPIRRLSKFLPMGEDYLRAREIDQAGDAGDLQQYKNLIDTEGELPELVAHEAEPEPEGQVEPARGAAAVKAQLQRSNKRRAAATIEVEPPADPIDEEVAAIRMSLEPDRIAHNPQWLPGLKDRIAHLPKGAERVMLEAEFAEAEAELAAARRQDDLPGEGEGAPT